MKIWIRIGVERDGPRPPQRPASANAEVRCLHPEGFIRALFLRPFTLLAPKREGSSCEAERPSGEQLSRPRRTSRGRFPQAGWAGGTRLLAALPNTQKSTPATRKLLKIERFFVKWAPTSNRFWVKNRSCRKQRTKPRLTGTRIAISDFGFLALFIKNSAATTRGQRSLSRTKLLRPSATQRVVRAVVASANLYGGRPPIFTAAYVTLARGDRHEWATSNASRVI
jgi:hypothetical protein